MNKLLRLMALALIAVACASGGETVHERIARQVDAIRIIDTHEHLPPEPSRLKQQRSLFTTLHYALSDMWADGLDRRLADSLFNDPAVPLQEKWDLMAPYWENVRNTAYTRTFLRAFKDIYDIADVNESTFAELSEKIQAANQPGFYHDVLYRRAGIDLAICDIGLPGRELDPELFRAVLRLDDFLLQWNALSSVRETWGIEVRSLEDWERALDEAFRKAKEWGFVGIKSGLAYNRTLNYEPTSREQAREIFDRVLADPSLTGSMPFEQKKPFQDYMFGLIADRCAEHDLPLQVHTGFFYDTWRDVTQANPTNLTPFIIRHPRTRFILMHGGYPFGVELLAMAKNLPNVVLDMCWLYIISPRFAADFLDQAIETVPRDKILGFGGDYVVAEGSYGHAMLCREVVSRVLADKVMAGYLSEEEALDYARAILRDNVIKAFDLRL